MYLKCKMKYISILIISLLLILPLIIFVKAETTFFDSEDNFIMGVNTQTNGNGGGSGGGNNPTCNPLWICDKWSSCSNNLRSRSCVDINYCNSNQSPPLLLSCSQPLPSDRIIGCVTFVNLDGLIVRWKLNVLGFDVLDEGIYKWKHNTNC